MTKPNSSRGFTIVELLISTAVFSTILVLCATAIVQVGRIFYKGVTINRTQEAARRVIEDVSQAIQFGANTGDKSFKRPDTPVISNYTNPNLTVYAICLGEIRYSYSTSSSLGTDSGQSRHVLWKDRIGSTDTCTTADLRADQPSSNGIELLGGNMRLSSFNVIPGSSNLWSINISVAYGSTNDLFETNGDGSPNYNKCISNNSGGQFCAVSSLNTNVAKRL